MTAGPSGAAAAEPAPAASSPRVLIVPRLTDPRWFVFACQCVLLLYALNSPGFSRDLGKFAAAFLGCAGLDLAILLLWKRLLLFPLSGLNATMGITLMVDSPDAWPYALTGVFAVLGKHCIRVEGKHIFNPWNFGLVVAMLFFSDQVTTAPGRWGGEILGRADCLLPSLLGLGTWPNLAARPWVGMVDVALLGVIASWWARRLDLSVTYLLTFAAGALLRAWIEGVHPAVKLAPMAGTVFVLYTFFVITDPMTNPTTRGGRIAFGVALGAVDAVLRHLEILNSPFYALFLLNGLAPAIPSYRWADRRIWRLRAIPLGRAFAGARTGARTGPSGGRAGPA